ncbi:hypothetical protein CR513_37472, partial [Mucuna pruriens]
MATAGFGFAEAYVTRMLYKEKMKKRAQEEEAENNTHMKTPTIKMGSQDKTSIRCFSWLSNHQQSKISRISDYDDTEAFNS